MLEQSELRAETRAAYFPAPSLAASTHFGQVVSIMGALFVSFLVTRQLFSSNKRATWYINRSVAAFHNSSLIAVLAGRVTSHHHSRIAIQIVR